ncbi:MAG TPA: diguanylate cyclase [Sphaerochaeta sp.]|nr:diguanylate cyclase [Sphaerochaeta sp.]
MQNRWWRIPLRMGVLGTLPLALNAVFVVLSLFNGMIFSIDAENIYSRGPYFFLVPFCNFLYLIGGQSHNLMHIKRKGKGLTHFYTIILPIPLMIAAILQAHIEYVGLLYLAAALTLLVMFLHTQNTHASRDHLTSLYNRSVAEQALACLFKSKSDGFLIGGMLMDINGFKQVNDQYGHDVGDRCLRYFAHMLNESFPRTWLICRYGGDEFLLFGKIDSEIAMEEELVTFKKNLAQFNAEKKLPFVLSISIGMDVAERTNPSDFLKTLDTNMYLTKKQHYSVVAETEGEKLPCSSALTTGLLL